ncbi:MAG TPA: SPFH domain-containing protein, partial [Candidatus Sumerlaeota bacterium]|nr:SPFH domain-containing protein [Candidatus Sumerlaeota bacterium]
MQILMLLVGFWWVFIILVVLVCYKLVLRLFGMVIIPQDSIGIINKKFVLFGKNRTLPDGCIIALNGEAGIQADTLAPGIHFWFWPWQFEVRIEKFITIAETRIGIVESRDGVSLSDGRVLARKVACDSFQNARQFLLNGGERGPQISIIPPGTYRINTGLFFVAQEPVLEIEDNMVGIVTTREGKALSSGDIAGKEVEGHNMFQDGQSFIDNGGYKGLQVQVMLAGRYFLNPRFATVETRPMTEVPIAHAGVVIAYVGEVGVDVTGDTFKHGNLVTKGQKGVWAEPLDPGKYPINPYTHRVEIVPTANVVLNWATGKTEAHKLDANLSTITVRSSDGFTFNLDVSQIIHVPRNDAPKVIARFGSMANLVTQVL